MIEENQIPDYLKKVIEDQTKVFGEKFSIEHRAEIPPYDKMPITNGNRWLKIPNITCVFVDMKNSTKLSASVDPEKVAKAYQLFTDTAVRIFNQLEAAFIDIKGDGVFALFNPGFSYSALCGAVTFKTFVTEVFMNKIPLAKETGLGVHIGIDVKEVLLKRIGIPRSDYQNPVWAGKPINMAAKLASLSKKDEVFISSRFHLSLKEDKALNSCGCGEENIKKSLWNEYDLSDDHRFDFSKAYYLTSHWCKTHGKEYCEELIKIEKTKR